MNFLNGSTKLPGCPDFSENALSGHFYTEVSTRILIIPTHCSGKTFKASQKRTCLFLCRSDKGSLQLFTYLFGFGGHTWWHSGLSHGSSVKAHSWQCLGIHAWYQEWNLSQLAVCKGNAVTTELSVQLGQPSLPSCRLTAWPQKVETLLYLSNALRMDQASVRNFA